MRASLLLLLALVLPAAEAQVRNRLYQQSGPAVVDEVRHLIATRDCGAAVRQLKVGLDEARPEVALLAGSMYENGICVKRSWDQAVAFYVQAHDGGLPEAAERLAAGYADPAQGPDVAAALWWSLRGRGALYFSGSSSCAVGTEAEQDPDRFVAVLRGWDPSLLAICNYVAGVISAVTADMKYPRRREASAMRGEATLRFLPAVPRIDVKQGPEGEFRLAGWRDGDAAREREAAAAGEGFEATLRESARHALRRYPQPAGIPPGLQVTARFVFVIE